MANFQNLDDQGLWDSSNPISALDNIGLNEQCLMQNVKNPNYVLLDNVSDGLQFDTILSNVIPDDFSSAWNDEDFIFEELITSNAEDPEGIRDYNLPLQHSDNIVLDAELDQSDSFQPPGNGSSGSSLQVLSAAQPINFHHNTSTSVNLNNKKPIGYELISSKVGLKFDELPTSSHHNAGQVPNKPAVVPSQVLQGRPNSKTNLNSAQAGKKAPRRRRNNCPKEKLYMRQEPFSDEEEEKKRQNAVKAYRNRQRHSTEIGKLKDENEELKKRLQEKDHLLQEKDNIIKAFYEVQKQKNKVLLNLKSEISKLLVTEESINVIHPLCSQS